MEAIRHRDGRLSHFSDILEDLKQYLREIPRKTQEIGDALDLDYEQTNKLLQLARDKGLVERELGQGVYVHKLRPTFHSTHADLALRNTVPPYTPSGKEFIGPRRDKGAYWREARSRCVEALRTAAEQSGEPYVHDNEKILDMIEVLELRERGTTKQRDYRQRNMR